MEKDDKCKRLSYKPEDISEITKKSKRKLSHSNIKDNESNREKYHLFSRAETKNSYSNSSNIFRIYSDLTKADLIKMLESKTDDIVKEYIMKQINDINHNTSVYSNSKLMEKFAPELGQLLFDMENHGCDLSKLNLTFFGDNVGDCFNRLVEEKVWFMKFYS